MVMGSRLGTDITITAGTRLVRELEDMECAPATSNC